MVTSGILVSITTREPRGNHYITFGTLLHLYGTIALWLYVEQLELTKEIV
jgi:hypothetical protein